MKFWNIFLELCNNVGKAPNAVAKEIGISSGAITFWKTDQRRPTPRMLEKISAYFGVSVNYLLGYETKKENAPGEMILTESENMLVELFRSLPPDKQELVAQTVKAFADSQK